MTDKIPILLDGHEVGLVEGWKEDDRGLYIEAVVTDPYAAKLFTEKDLAVIGSSHGWAIQRRASGNPKSENPDEPQ